MAYWFKILLTLSLVLPFHSQAKYRVFVLKIVDAKSGQEREVVSSLDPLQYGSYHPLKNTEQVTYTDTWMCQGNTSNFTPYCKKNELLPAAKP